jgi:hypothetical protein
MISIGVRCAANAGSWLPRPPVLVDRLPAPKPSVKAWPWTASAAVGLGDTLTVQVMVDTRGQAITSASVFVSFDATVFSPVGGGAADELIMPFQTGTFLNGQVYENSLGGDQLADSQANGLSGFQLNYMVVSGPNLAGGRSAAIGLGALASFRLRVMGLPGAAGGYVHLDASGRSIPGPIYPRADNPGVEYGFQVEASAVEIRVVPYGLIPIADRVLIPGHRVELDLRPHYLGEGEVPVWSFVSAAPQDLTVAVEDNRLMLQAATTASGRTMVEYSVKPGEGDPLTGRFTVAFEQPQRLADRSLEWDEDAGWVEYELDTFLHSGSSTTAFSWSVEAGGRVEAAIGDGRLRLRGPDDWSGTDEIRLYLHPAGEESEEVSIAITVQPLNDAPVVRPPQTLSLTIGEQRAGEPLAVLVQDVDDPLAALDIRVLGDEVVQVEIRQDRLLVQGLQAGMGTVRIQATDPQGLQAEGIWPIHVVAAGAEPVLGFLPTLLLAAGEDYVLRLDDFVSDVDTPFQYLLWDWTLEGPIQAELLADGIHLRILGQAAGSGRMYLVVTDEQGNSASGVMRIDVTSERSIATLVEAQIQVEDIKPSVFPNPFNASVSLKYSLASGAYLRLEVVDIHGRRVKRLADGWAPARPNQMVWDGRDEAGREAASGLYFYVAACGAGVAGCCCCGKWRRSKNAGVDTGRG